MIKAEVNITGTISRSAVVRTDKNNNSYLAFAVTVNLRSSDQTTLPIAIYVSLPNGQQSDFAKLTEGKRVVINGTMDIHKKDDHLTFFLTAKYIATEGVADIDAISGTMSFRGHLRSNNVYEEKTSKNGDKQFLRFSAYSAEKDGDKFTSTWVNFVRFPDKDSSIDTIKEDWMVAKAHVSIRGSLDLEVYNGKVNINSRVIEMCPYIKPTETNN